MSTRQAGEWKRFSVDLVTTLNSLYKLDERVKSLKNLLETVEKYNEDYSWFDKRDLNSSFLRFEKICVKTENPQLLEMTVKIRSLTVIENPGKRLLSAFPNMKHKAFEFLCSFVQEKAFGTVSWDYSHQAYSIGGRTSLLYMFFWGILGIF